MCKLSCDIEHEIHLLSKLIESQVEALETAHELMSSYHRAKKFAYETTRERLQMILNEYYNREPWLCDKKESSAS